MQAQDGSYSSQMNNSDAIGSGPNPQGIPPALQIVLVDDSILMREHIVDSLYAVEGVGAIREALDVPSGLRLVQERQPDVLIIDVELPGQSGLDLLRLVRRRDTNTVIIMFSMHDHPSLRQKCAGLGADFFFHKLTEFEKVADVCREVIQRRRQKDGPNPTI